MAKRGRKPGSFMPAADRKLLETMAVPAEVIGGTQPPLTPEERQAKARELQAKRVRDRELSNLALDLWHALQHHCTDAFYQTPDYRALRVRALRITPSED